MSAKNVSQSKSLTEKRSIFPDIVIGRLPIYLRTLKRLMQQGQGSDLQPGIGGASGDQFRPDPQGS
jgi:hypothetical protein